MPGVEYIFERQGVDVEFMTNFFDQKCVSKSTNINPTNEVFVLKEKGVVETVVFLVIDFVVSNREYMCGVSIAIAGVNKGSGG